MTKPAPSLLPVRTAPAAGRQTVARRDPAASREALVGAAVAEFARKGFEGARVDEIAAGAGLNKQLVYHYFGSKQGLYLAALESVYMQIREKERRLSLGELEPREAMAQLVGFSFDYLLEHPEFISLLADENRNKGEHILGSDKLRRMHTPFRDMLEATLDNGVRSGVFRGDFDAVNVYISIAGISYFFFSNNHTLSAIFGRSLASRAALARRRRHVIEFTLNALRPEAG
ncbi:TetR/AcrR family transcriptional regulator [Ramlibacter sp.]|uniref:TetR/AcrR family transcriptional regulator n=1 Tax=Ramlibacter sp. TaxID=1917967 RepID=UPI002B6C21FA|nr:TetR/AcrR family transcriptional regulator [Ramlibacter sp.]HWI80738.1 TetR/AcrR family transcriptional regulator [Ramlibacter sp.]